MTPSLFTLVLLDFADTVGNVFNTYMHISFVILGGLVVWVGFILARFILNGCSFRGRGRRR